MRLLYVIENLERNFVNTNVGTFVRFVRELGWQVRVLTNITDETKGIEEFVEGVPVIRASSISAIPRFLFGWHADYDVVFSYNGRRHNIVLPALKLFRGKRYIIKTDSNIGWNVSGLRSVARSLLVIGVPLRLADLVLVESPRLEAALGSIAGRGRTFLLPNCLSWQRLEQVEARLRSGVVGGRKACPFILYVGRISPEKGVDVLVEAFARVAPRHPAWRVFIVGPVSDGRYNEWLRRRVSELGLTDSVVFVGECYGDELWWWYWGADIFCLPSRREGMPNALTEAMFFGKAIISARVGQVDYQLDEGACGVMFRPGSAEELARVVLDLIHSPARRDQLGRAARQRAREEFSFETRYAALREVFSGWR